MFFLSLTLARRTIANRNGESLIHCKGSLNIMLRFIFQLISAVMMAKNAYNLCVLNLTTRHVRVVTPDYTTGAEFIKSLVLCWRMS